ncbi:hypothetical protein JCM16303_003440, partial [Sporobolomyces ruberrimus]
MARTATLHFVSLRNCLVNLPLSITGPLSQRGVAPQSIAVQLSFKVGGATKTIVAGWTGLSSSVESVTSQLSQRGGGQSRAQLGGERIEIDPQYAGMFEAGMTEGTQ